MSRHAFRSMRYYRIGRHIRESNYPALPHAILHPGIFEQDVVVRALERSHNGYIVARRGEGEMTAVMKTVPKKSIPFANVFLWCALVTGSLVYSASSYAESDVDKGLRIAEEADRRNNEFGDNVVDLTMQIAASPDNIISREMRQMTLEVVGDGDKSIIVFDRPRDLKGTAILTFSHKTEADEQWLYLPALKRVKRISSTDKSGPFMGSEFAFEDLSSQEVEKYNYKYLGDETIAGEPSYVVERIPIDKYSGYSRQVTWLDHKEYRLQRVDYYDRKGALLKTMVATDHQKYLDRYWRPRTLTMTNHQTGKSTTLEFDNYRFRTGLQDADFSPSAISRIR